MERARNGIAYRRTGSGPAVVLLHGIPGQGRAWAAVETEVGADFEVVTVDLIGFGASHRPARPSITNVGPSVQAEAIATLLDEIGIQQATIVGHDFGAPIGTLLAAARPDLVRALFLLAGNTFPDTPIPFPLSLTTTPVIGAPSARLLFSTPSLALMLRQGTGRGCGSPSAAVYLGDRAQRRTIAAIFAGALTRLEEIYQPVAEALSAIQAPVLVGWGDADPFFPIAQGARTADAAVDGRLHVFEGAGHFLPHERPSEIAREIIELATLATR